MNGVSVIEDASWLRKQDDTGHMNLAELESVLKGVSSYGTVLENVKIDDIHSFCYCDLLVEFNADQRQTNTNSWNI